MNNFELIDSSGFEIVAFRDLSLPYQLALAYYMSVDGDAWDLFAKLPKRSNDNDILRHALTSAMPLYVEHYGDIKFGISLIPSDAFAKAYVEYHLENAFGSWDEYMESASNFLGPKHSTTDRWPVILSSDEDEILQDGHNRAHCYLNAGQTDIPAVFFPSQAQLRSKP